MGTEALHLVDGGTAGGGAEVGRRQVVVTAANNLMHLTPRSGKRLIQSIGNELPFLRR